MMKKIGSIKLVWGENGVFITVLIKVSRLQQKVQHNPTNFIILLNDP